MDFSHGKHDYLYLLELMLILNEFYNLQTRLEAGTHSNKLRIKTESTAVK